MDSSRLRLVTLALIAFAGCGGGDDDASTEAAAPPTPVTTTTTGPATGTSATTPPAATEDAGAVDVSRKEEVTVKGRKGDTLTLLGQYSTTLAGKPKRREKVQVKLIGIRGPFSGYTLPAGKKLMGLDLQVKNVGEISYEDALPSGTLILVGGETGKPTNLISGTSKSPCENPSLKLKPGQTKTFCAAFEVAKTARLQTFQYATDSGYGDTALFRLR